MAELYFHRLHEKSSMCYSVSCGRICIMYLVYEYHLSVPRFDLHW